MQNITPCLWFDKNGEEALKFYTSVFKNSRINNISYYGEDMPLPKGTFLIASFELNGQQLMILNGGPAFKLTPAFSLYVNCDDQEEIDYYWEKLSEGGSKDQCGWLTDKYGLSWQIVPKNLEDILNFKDPDKSKKAWQAMMKMSKLDIAELKRASSE